MPKSVGQVKIAKHADRDVMVPFRQMANVTYVGHIYLRPGRGWDIGRCDNEFDRVRNEDCKLFLMWHC